MRDLIADIRAPWKLLYLDYVRDEKNGYLSVALPFESDNEVSLCI